MIQQYITDRLRKSLEEAVKSGEVRIEVIPSFTIETPPNKQFGDFSSNAALVLARHAGMSPRDLAQILVKRLTPDSLIERVEVAGPGFINF